MVLGGIVAQGDEIKSSASAAVGSLPGSRSPGVDSSGASSANQNASEGTSSADLHVRRGWRLPVAATGQSASFSCVVFSGFSLLFLLEDGPGFRGFVERKEGSVGLSVAQTITGRRDPFAAAYFGGVTIVSYVGRCVVGVGALILDVPLAGAFTIVTFIHCLHSLHRRLRVSGSQRRSARAGRGDLPRPR